MIVFSNHMARSLIRTDESLNRDWSCRVFSIAAVAFFVSVAATSAHPISMSEAVVNVHQDRIDVALSVLAEDLVLYHSVAADSENRFPGEPLRKAASKHQKFVIAGLSIRNGDGDGLSASLTSIDVKGIPESGVLQSDVKQHSVIYHLVYKLKSKPRFVTVAQTFGGEEAVIPSIMDCTMLQSGVLIDTPEPLPYGRRFTVHLDWDNPPKPPKNWRELRDRRKKQLQERLGIASYSGLYSFIYVTRHEVRHELLVPLLTLEQWLPIDRREADYLDVDEQEAAQAKIQSFFRKHAPVRIDNRDMLPVLARLNFLGLDIRDFARNAKPRRISVYQARVGVILSYPIDSPPRNISLEWKLFSPHAPFLRSVIYEFDKPPVEHFFRTAEPTLQLMTDSAITTVKPRSESIASSAVGSDKEASAVSTALLRNVYRAFDHRDDEDIYDALSESVHGPLLRMLYLQIRRSLLMAEQGGARSRVREMEPVAGRVVRRSGEDIQVEQRWRITGTVEHWGHIHTQENEYAAVMTLSRLDGRWKITALRFTEQKRVRFQTGLRSLKSAL